MYIIVKSKLVDNKTAEPDVFSPEAYKYWDFYNILLEHATIIYLKNKCLSNNPDTIIWKLEASTI